MFSAGAVLATLFFAAAVWANLEASLFNPAVSASTTIGSMSCPVILTRGEIGSVSATFFNPGPNPTSPTVRMTNSYLAITSMQAADRRLRIEPNQTVTAEWPIPAENLVWGLFVFVRLYQHASFPLPSASASCGVIVLAVPWLSGTALVALILGFSALGMGLGLTMVAVRERSGVFYSLLTAGLVIATGSIVAMLGHWLLGLILLILVVVGTIVIGATRLAGGP